MQSNLGIKLALVLASAWIFCGSASAQEPGYGMGPGMRHHMMAGPGHMTGPAMMQGQREARLQALGLSEEQRAKIDAIREETRRKNWDAIGQIRAERFKLRQMFRAEQVDPGTVVEQRRKVDDLRRQVMRARLEARNQILALLTPEQRQTARSFGPLRRGRG
jgi:Spy/CpxP family protein refolding chaperone